MQSQGMIDGLVDGLRVEYLGLTVTTRAETEVAIPQLDHHLLVKGLFSVGYRVIQLTSRVIQRQANPWCDGLFLYLLL